MQTYFLDDQTFAQFRAYIYDLTGIDIPRASAICSIPGSSVEPAKRIWTTGQAI